MNVSGRSIRVFGEQQSMAAAVHIRNIDSAVGADQAMARLGDQDAAFSAQNACALLQGELGHAGVELVTSRPSAGRRAWVYLVKLYKLPFGLGNDFVLDDQNVPRLQPALGM